MRLGILLFEKKDYLCYTFSTTVENNMLLPIQHIDDVQPFVAHKNEIIFRKNGDLTLGVYVFSDKDTFDTPQALECRGIAFDANGAIISRPLHKFFNLGENSNSSLDAVRQKKLINVFEKLDGSMIATANLNGQAVFRSKGSFGSDVVKLTNHMVDNGFEHVLEFAQRCVDNNLTAIFELTHPLARIVVDPGEPNLRLLHVRDNYSGAYVLMDSTHAVHTWIAQMNIELVPRYNVTLDEALQNLENMEHKEGYVLQFDDGSMVKVKSPWYLRLHRSVTFMRERDIAILALHEDLDDLKGMLRSNNMDMSAVEEVETRLKNIMLGYTTEIDRLYEQHKHLDKKEFSIALKGNPLHYFLMKKYSGSEDIGLITWYEKKQMPADFTLRVLNDVVFEESQPATKMGLK